MKDIMDVAVVGLMGLGAWGWFTTTAVYTAYFG